MPPQHLAVGPFDDTRPRLLDPRRHEGSVVTVWNETDVLAIRLVCHREIVVPCDLPNLVLRVAADREKEPLHLLLRKRVQHVALVLDRVDGLSQACPSAGLLQPGIVPGGNVVSLQEGRAPHQEIELQAVVAGEAWIGGPAP